MNLRTKTFLIITALFLSAFFIMGILLSSFILSGYKNEENQVINDKVLQAQSAISDMLDNLDTLTTDWAQWNDTYQYVQDHNPGYINSNYVYTTFSNNGLNLAAIIDINGQLIYSRYFQWTITNSDDSISQAYSLEETEIPESLKAFLMAGSPLLSQSETDMGAKGIISLPDAPMLVVSHPILTSQGNGPARGVLIFGQYLDSYTLSRISRVTHLNIVGYLPNDPSLPDDFRNILPSFAGGETTAVQVLNDNTISGYSLVKDINGETALIFRVDSSRILYAQSRNDLSYFILALLAFGLLFITAILLILERMVISPVANLSSRVNMIGRKGDLSSRISISGKDEISSLGTNINGMLDNLEQSRRLRQESETFNYALLQDSPNPIEVMNPDGSIRYVNPALERITGYSQNQLIGRKPPFPWWTNENARQYLDELSTTTATGVQRIEKRYLRFNGESFWVDITTTAIKQDNEIKYFISNWVDISERKQAEEALRESETRFRALAELLPDLVFEIDLQGKLVFMNKVAFSIFGYPPEEYSNLHLEDLLAREDQPTANQNFRKIISGEIISHTEYTAVRKDGSRFPAFIHAAPIHDNQGSITGLRGILVDITTQKSIEAELRASEGYSSSLLNSAPNPIIVTNIDSTIRYVNPALEQLTGYSSSELIGKSAPYPWYKEAQTEASTVEDMPAKEVEKKGVERCYRKRNGEMFWVTVTNNPFVENNQVQYYIGNWVDITERKKNEDALKASREQLEKLYQLEKNTREALQVEIRSRTEFTRALVHELKTPLTPIMASSELLVEELTTEPLLGLAKNVHRGAENMNRRVDELLDLARGEIGMLRVNLNPVDPSRVFNEVIKYMEPSARSNGMSLALNIPEKIPVIMADDERMRQILFNLISNAIKYSYSGCAIKLGAKVEGENLITEVQDSGRGMSAEEQEKLFQPYYRIEGRERLSGLGLGLALSRQLVELQNGKIWVKSQKGVGSTFYFSLPIKPDYDAEVKDEIGEN